MASQQTDPAPVLSLRVLTLNCWGLKYLSKHRRERLTEIGSRLANHSPPLDVVGLQECWTFEDYVSVREQTRSILPHGKFYQSGIFGGGLVILTRWPIEDSSMFRYPLNGRPTAFFRGDWFVGKGVACAKIRLPDGQTLAVFNTHLHAPYEREPNDSYICHRTAQAWEIARLMRGALEQGSLVIGLGDFNMVPMSFAHVLVEGRGNVKDAWRQLKPSSSIGASIDEAEKERRRTTGILGVPTVEEGLLEHGHTCDSEFNTWRWSKAHRKALEQGRDRQVGLQEPDPKAKRLDYIFIGNQGSSWTAERAQVSMTERHPNLKCSLSDHFAVEAHLVRGSQMASRLKEITIEGINTEIEIGGHEMAEMSQGDLQMATLNPTKPTLTPAFYGDVLEMIRIYTLRQRKQRRWQLSHFLVSCAMSIGCFVAVWWSPGNYVSFILLLVSSLGLMAGTVNGLIGGLFVGSELRALKEFEWEVCNAIRLAGGEAFEEVQLRDWSD